MKTLSDYSFIRGFCYPGAAFLPEEQMKKEFGYARKLDLNSVRVWLSFARYEEDPEKFINDVVRFVRNAYDMGITTMPVLLSSGRVLHEDYDNGCFSRIDKYVADVVAALKDEPGLFMWDIMNEPSYNDYINKSPADELAVRWERINSYVRYVCRLVKSLDSENAITVGHTFMKDVADTVDEVDVFCFHDYLPTRKQIIASYEAAVELSKKTGKPFMNSELCCLCRANPYDISLEICNDYNTGWYLFELMITGYWEDVHGIFYPDGTVRDPSIPAAVMGYRRNRSTEGFVLPNPNKEGHATIAINMVAEALGENTVSFRDADRYIEKVLEAAEYCANLLECCELVPMYNPPTRQIAILRKNGDLAGARRLAYELANTLKEACTLL